MSGDHPPLQDDGLQTRNHPLVHAAEQAARSLSGPLYILGGPRMQRGTSGECFPQAELQPGQSQRGRLGLSRALLHLCLGSCCH